MFSTPAIWNCCLNSKSSLKGCRTDVKMELKKPCWTNSWRFDPAFLLAAGIPHSQLCTFPAWTSHPTAVRSFYGSAFGKSNHYFISKLLILASSFPAFSAHPFINRNHHIFQQEFGWRADIHPFLSFFWNKLVFLGTITGRGKNQCLTFNSWVSCAWNSRALFQLFLFSNPASRIRYLNFFITHVR